MPKKGQKRKKKISEQIFKITLVAIGVILLLGFLIIISYYFWEQSYHYKIYPHIYIGQREVSGQTFLQTLEEFSQVKSDFENNGLTFQYQDYKVVVPTVDIKDESAGISVDILTINSNATVDLAYKIGRSGDPKKDLLKKIELFFHPEKVNPQYTLNEEELVKILTEKFSEFENPAQDAQLTFTSEGEIQVTNESEGQVFQWADVIQEVRDNISQWQNQPIILELEPDYPQLKKVETGEMVKEVESLLALAPLTLVYEDKNWSVDKMTVQDWLKFSPDGVALNTENVISYLENEIASEINQTVKEGKFNVMKHNDGQITVEQFQQGEPGRELEKKKSAQAIADNWIEQKNNHINLIVAKIEPKATPDNISQLGIKELLGTGHTNFAGSPYNRIQNIKKGAEILHGLLIAPGETFSLVNALGHIDGVNGWLPELVIKGDKTVPEYGGGLCQIGTTAFRAALNSGLEIVERHNHSYVVSYYDYHGKAGVDASIYEPKPDFRFKNDTDNYILWQSRIEGYDIYFDFWGTSDGREAYFTEPINYNYVSPPETIITEVDTLAPGEIKCTEKAHTGLTAEFDYIIKYPDGSERKQTFTSVYKALPAVCEKGKEPDENEQSENENNETSNIVDDNSESDEVNSNDKASEDKLNNSNSSNSNKKKQKNKKQS